MAANDRYIEEISHEQLLTDQEERELAAKAKIGDARALEKLTKANLKFVVYLANQYRNKGLSEDDLISEGNIGMMHAAQKFDGDKGTRFVNFAAPYIRHSIEKALKEQTIEYKVSKADKRNSGQPVRALSLDQPVPVGSNNNFTLQNILENANSPHADENLTKQLLSGEISQGIGQLDARERKVISLYFGLKDNEHYTMAEIGEMMDIKRERVRQIRDKAIRKLKKVLK